MLWGAIELPQTPHKHKDNFCLPLPCPSTQKLFSVWSSSPLNCFAYWTSVLFKRDFKSKKCLIVSGTAQALYTSPLMFVPLVPITKPCTMEVLNKYLWIKTNKYVIHSSIYLLTGETLVQLLLGCEGHMPLTSVSPVTASLQLASECGQQVSLFPFTVSSLCNLCCIPDHFSFRVKVRSY